MLSGILHSKVMLHAAGVVLFATISGAGAAQFTWGPSYALNSTAFTDEAAENAADSKPCVAAGDGTVVACWEARPVGPSTQAVIKFARSEDDGLTWSPTQSLSQTNLLSGPGPQVYYAGGAHWSAFWKVEPDVLNPSSPTHLVSLSSDDGLTWSTPTGIQSVTVQSAPYQELLAGNNAGIFLRKAGNGRVFEKSTDGGIVWQLAGELPSEISYLAHAGGSNWIAGASTGEGNPTQDYLSENHGQSWTQLTSEQKPSAVGAVTGIQSDHTGTVVATGIRTPGPQGTIYTVECYSTVSKDFGLTWASPVLVHSQTETDSSTIVAYSARPQPVWMTGERWAVVMPHTLASRQVPLDVNRIESIKIFSAGSTNGASSWESATFVIVPAVRGTIAPPPFSYAGAGLGTVVAWESKTLPTEPNSYVDGESLGSDMDIIYRIFKQRPSPAAARDWALYQ